MGALNALYAKYQDRVEFRLVYIREAHPTDGWQVQANIRDQILFEDPKSLKDRQLVAGSCVKTLGIKFPAVVDTLDDGVERLYSGWPDRLYVVGVDGKLVHVGEMGPRGFVVSQVADLLAKLYP